MLVTRFQLENPVLIRASGDEELYNDYLIFKVPILPAYAITDTRLDIDKSMNTNSNASCPPYELVNDTLITPGIAWDMEYKSSGGLTVYHNGIKDYSLLFPHVESYGLRQRLGNFALEANNAFHSQSWISYCFTAGGVIEGLFYNKFNRTNFIKLVELAMYDEIITNTEASFLYDIHKSCDRIQLYKNQEQIPNRKKAIELSIIYDRLIKLNWFSRSKNKQKRISKLVSKMKA